MEVKTQNREYLIRLFFNTSIFHFIGTLIAKRTITKNRFVSVRSHETPRTDSDKHCDQNKPNV